MSLILDPRKQVIDLTIFYVEEKKAHGTAVFHFIKSKQDFTYWNSKGYHTAEEIQQIREENQAKERAGQVMIDTTRVIEAINTRWRRLTWGDQNSIYSKSIRSMQLSDGRAKSEFDGILFRDSKLKTCLKQWDLKDDAGNPIECTPQNIDLLIPEVAMELIRQFETLTEPSEEDLKN